MLRCYRVTLTFGGRDEREAPCVPKCGGVFECVNFTSMTYKPLCSCQMRYPLSGEDKLRCMAVEKATAVLQNTFGHSSFRPGQLEAVVGALHGRDVFARMATGAGKSLPMFVVPLSYSAKAVGVVISPLNSLMDEQV